MSSPSARDAAAREAAQGVFDRPLLIEAGAGTGKTTTLVTRVLSWSLGVGWARSAEDIAAGLARPRADDSADGSGDRHDIAAATLQAVVAITFTEAAAAEMAARLASDLAHVTDGTEDEVVGFDPGLLPAGIDAGERRRRAAYLLEAFDHLTVGTIHAFCYGLLKTYALEAGLHPELTVDAEGRELEAIGRLAVEQWVQEAYSGEDDTSFLALAAHGIGPGRLLEAALQWLLEGPPSDVLGADPLRSEASAAFVGSLATEVDRVIDRVAEPFADLPPGRLAVRVVAALVETRRILGTDEELFGGERWREIWPDNLLKRLSDWGDGRTRSKEEAERLDDLEAFAPTVASAARRVAILRDLEPDLLTAAREALAPMIAEIEHEMRARGVITFSGLLRQALSLLENSPSVLTRERRRIRLLLVDEFQDTDSVQSRIVRLLGLEGETDRRPSLFVVGDPKQSIYAWRDADLAAYEAFAEALLAQDGERHVLSRNFRSVPAILDEVERVIEPVMRYRHGIQPAFHPLESTLEDRPSADVNPVEYWVSWRAAEIGGALEPTSYSEAQEIEAEAVATDIRRLHDRGGVPWSRFAILFRKSGSQPPFLDALRRLDVPFAVTRDRNYYQRREIIEAAAWVRAIVNPNDHLALVTVLRSVAVGVPDAALIPLWRHALPRLATELGGPTGGPADGALREIRRVVDKARREVPESIPGLERIEGWDENLVAALAALARLREAYRDLPADLFVRELRSEILLEASEAARFQGKFRLANLGRFFRRLETALESDEADVHAVLRVLRLGVMEGREAEEATPRDAAAEAVQVMTIHTAKGLEFDHVYLVQLHTRTRMGGNDLLEVGEVRPGQWAYHLFGAPTPDFAEIEAHRDATEAAEAVRTLYVAMTRAARRLVLVGSWPGTLRPKEPERAQSYIDLVQNRRGHPESLLELAADPSLALTGFRDLDGIRWRFPGGEHTLRAGRRPRSSPDWLPDAAGFERAQRAHRDRRRAAAGRMERPWTEPVTSSSAGAFEALAIPFRDSDADRATTGTEAREVARDAGTEVHRCLERWDLEADPAEEIATQRRTLAERLEGAPSAYRDEVIERFERLATGRLVVRLREIAPHVVGREIPLLLPPGDADAPLHCFSGAIDLLYRDPDRDGELVIADFKTDRLDDDAEITARAEIYRSQEERYALAVQQALELPAPPRTEIWFLWPDRIRSTETD